MCRKLREPIILQLSSFEDSDAGVASLRDLHCAASLEHCASSSQTLWMLFPETRASKAFSVRSLTWPLTHTLPTKQLIVQLVKVLQSATCWLDPTEYCCRLSTRLGVFFDMYFPFADYLPSDDEINCVSLHAMEQCKCMLACFSFCFPFAVPSVFAFATEGGAVNGLDERMHVLLHQRKIIFLAHFGDWLTSLNQCHFTSAECCFRQSI